ncbi:MAG: sulfate/thiosulfate ABC transporter permease CysW, partial [Methylocystis sp.]
MSDIAIAPAARAKYRPVTEDSPLARHALIAMAVLFLSLFLLAPLAVVFIEALSKGLEPFLAAFRDPDALAAIRLTLLVAALATPANLVFGLAASWSIAKFSFPGKSILVTLIDLPFSVSPVVAGLGFVRVWGGQGLRGPGLADLG